MLSHLNVGCFPHPNRVQVIIGHWERFPSQHRLVLEGGPRIIFFLDWNLFYSFFHFFYFLSLKTSSWDLKGKTSLFIIPEHLEQLRKQNEWLKGS